MLHKTILLDYKKGFGLVEVLIVLLIVSTTMILALGTIANGLKVAKENEVSDMANGIMLRGLEYKQLDLPQNVITDMTYAQQYGTTFERCYKIDTDASDARKMVLVQVTSDCSVDIPINSCQTVYRLANTKGIEICNQIMFTNIDKSLNRLSPMDDTIRIVSSVSYRINGVTKYDSIEAYRHL